MVTSQVWRRLSITAAPRVPAATTRTGADHHHAAGRPPGTVTPPTGAWRLNVAVQVLFAFITTVVLGLEPEQSPLHPAKTEPASAVAVSVTVVLAG